MFDRILIANRGEIACRIIRTCRRLGIETVAVYSDADRNACHRMQADYAVWIGGSAPADSYLRQQAIIDAALATGAQAIHPGYGFLSENVSFAQACDAAGIVFIGPSAETIELMGSKARAKQTMDAAGVPTVPGYHGSDQEPEKLKAAATATGFPLMIKAAAGGGGKGMRIVRTEAEFLAELKSAQREAIGAFGDDRVILERYVERPRHIEVQVFGDQHGQIVHLYERDCSAQRRYQKVIEEAPAPNLDDTTRAAMGQAAVDAAAAVNYFNAGTVEFIMGADGDFYFMEMNTRLQVEHPVTEMITGIDLVEWQLKVAAGEPLPLMQSEIPRHGHAIEARIYAEDPATGFLPSSGRLSQVRFAPDARIDTGVAEGQEVTVHYDPMIAKLIVRGDDRNAALGALSEALAATSIAGPKTNIDFLLALAGSEIFRAGEMHTAFLDRHLEQVFPVVDAPREAVRTAAIAVLLKQERESQDAQLQSADPHSPWASSDGWRPGHPGKRVIALSRDDVHLNVDVWGCRGNYRIEWDHGESSEDVTAARQESNSIHYRIGHCARRLPCVVTDQLIQVRVGHRLFVFQSRDPFAFEGADAGGGDSIVAPMPGKIIAIETSPGASIAEGETLAIMEAMKMELTLKAPRDGEVDQIRAAVGEFVEADTPLILLKPKDN